jgi:uncharacterized BrkB/YihY/UPF0761 family membrane protein
VALNRVWGATRNRSYFRNQLLSLGLIFACGALALFSMVLTAVNQQFLRNLLGADFPLLSWLGVLFFKLAAVPISILVLFLIYWILPNVSVPWRRVVPVAVAVGLLLEGLKWINLLTWPWSTGRSAFQRPFCCGVFSRRCWCWGAPSGRRGGASGRCRRARGDFRLTRRTKPS